MQSPASIGDYLINSLYNLGVRHVFGIPGDYVLTFMDKLNSSSLEIINMCDEQGAGFAADAYARLRGLGCVCITYGVGGLKLANTTAQAFAEESPVVIISGAPGVSERKTHRLLHHTVSDYNTQLKVFEQFTVAQAVLEDPNTAARQIDKALYAALTYNRPVYIEIPRDMVNARINTDLPPEKLAKWSDPDALQEAIDESVALINAASQPVILVGEEIHRFGLQDELISLIEKAGIPAASVMMGKSIMAEDHPLYLGVYMGAMGREDLCRYIESSDCFILLGVHLTDINLGMYTCRIDKERSIHATSHNLSIHRHSYEGIKLEEFVCGLIESDLHKRQPGRIPHPEPQEPFIPQRDNKLTLIKLFQRLNAMLDENTVVIPDIGESLWGSLDLFIHRGTKFLISACYASLGFAVPGAIGAQMADPSVRAIAIVGDGAFQMTGMELSAAARYGLNPIVIVINNSGYGTERPMLDGPFNDIQPWRFDRIPEVIGAGKGVSVNTEDELDEALSEAEEYDQSFFIIDAHIDRMDRSLALRRLAEHTPARGYATK